MDEEHQQRKFAHHKFRSAEEVAHALEEEAQTHPEVHQWLSVLMNSRRYRHRDYCPTLIGTLVAIVVALCRKIERLEERNAALAESQSPVIVMEHTNE